MTTETRRLRRTREGVVVSDRMQKTVVVMVERLVRHPLYGRVLRRRKKYSAHDEKSECRVGDRVRIMECRPLSATKSWRVVQVLRKAEAPDVQAEAVKPGVDISTEAARIQAEAAEQTEGAEG
jgi:small subunit ribosomal protein S17